MRPFSHLQPILQLDLRWPLTLVHDLWLHEHMKVHMLYINKPSLVQIGLQLFKWGHFHIFSLSYNLTSNDLWPRYINFDLINKWGVQCCIYDPTLVEIHQSMWKIEPNVIPFSRQTTKDNNRHQQTTTVDKVIPMCLSCSGRRHKNAKIYLEDNSIAPCNISTLWFPHLFLQELHASTNGSLHLQIRCHRQGADDALLVQIQYTGVNKVKKLF